MYSDPHQLYIVFNIVGVNNFTPTTIMHIGEQLYAFVINNVKICNGNMKFYVSSNLIYNNSTNCAIPPLIQ